MDGEEPTTVLGGLVLLVLALGLLLAGVAKLLWALGVLS